MKKLVKDILCSKFVVGMFMICFRKKIPCLRYFRSFEFPRNKDNYRAIGTLIWGFYEAAEIRSINKLMFVDLPVIELGSSSGIVSSFASRKMGSQKMICVEGNSELTPFIEKNIRNNNEKVNLTVLNKAIAYGQSEIDFQISDNTTSSTVVNEPNASSGYKTIKLKTITLEDILIENNIEEYILISDIEGAESEVLKNDQKALSKCRQIIIELHDDHSSNMYSIASLNSAIQNLGFRMCHRDGHVFVFEKL